MTDQPERTHVRITVTCGNGHIVGTWTDSVGEKYPFWCEQCDDRYGDGDLRAGKYPWSLTTEVVSTSPGA